MTPQELKSSLILALAYSLRMFGMFIILPIFAVYASNLADTPSEFQIGLALGVYGLTQALFQIPFGLASDRYGRKKIIYLGLFIFIVGSVVAGLSSNINLIILGRALQGAGAISAVLAAFVADLTTEEFRTRAMAIIGGSIGLTFILSLILGPILNSIIGVPGIFYLMACLSFIVFLIIKYFVPEKKINTNNNEMSFSTIKNILKRFDLQQLNFGIFALHATQIIMFMIIPFLIINNGGLDLKDHWMVYLPVLLISFLFTFPMIIVAEKLRKTKFVFLLSIIVLVTSQFLFIFMTNDFMGIFISLVIYFLGFNFLEASLPSMVSKIAPLNQKGLALGVYNTSQSLGIFAGGAIGGLIANHYGYDTSFLACLVLLVVWFVLSLRIKIPATKNDV
jgi:MFS family permease